MRLLTVTAVAVSYHELSFLTQDLEARGITFPQASTQARRQQRTVPCLRDGEVRCPDNS